MNDDTCAVNGCESPIRCRSLCYKHYMKMWRYGDTDSHVKFKPGGATSSNGYRMARKVGGHILNTKFEHRIVLFDEIGFGPHWCVECGRHVNWRLPIPDRLCVDHIDEDKLNNEPANLRQLCHACNIKRNRSHQANGDFAPRERSEKAVA